MNAFVFTGPTISAEDAREELAAVYLPPAAEGDVYRAALKRPLAIGIIDGYFQSVPSVRHKEILWAMSRGIHVFGSASIGALRAAELAAFGMEGVGAVFESYRDGLLEDDDEVAVAHGPAETGYAVGSEAMVNIRRTLRKAESAGIISQEVRTALECIAKKLFFPDRSYRAVLDHGRCCGMPANELARLHQWLPEGRTNQKREDAVAMLRMMRERLAQGLKPKKVSFSFENTAMWESSWRHAAELRSGGDAQAHAIGVDAVLDELRLEADKRHIAVALERFFAIRESYRLGMNVGEKSRDEAELMFRREHGLTDTVQIEQWKIENGLSDTEFDMLMMDEARLRWIHQISRAVLPISLTEHLRLSGHYSRLLSRAEAKARLLENFGCSNPSLEDTGMTEDDLLRWFFENLLRQKVPVDPMDYALSLGFATPHAFLRALLREYTYRRLLSKQQEERYVPAG